jgi:hypothetical protein
VIVAGQAAQLRTVLRLRDDCTFVVDVTDRDGERSAVLSCPGGVAIELDSSGVVDRLAAAVIEGGSCSGNVRNRSRRRASCRVRGRCGRRS